MPMRKKKVTTPHSTKNKYDWEKIKLEYLKSDFLTIKEFFEFKEIPLSNMNVRAGGWAREKKEYQKKVLQKATERGIAAESNNIAEARERQARLARFLQLKGAEKLRKVNPDELSVDDARKLVVGGLQEERKALGIEGGGVGNQSLTQININAGPKTNFDKDLQDASVEEVLELIAELKRARTRRLVEQTDADSSGEVQEGKVV